MRLAALLLCAGLAAPASAERLAPADVPEPLRPWIGWALGEEDRALCPSIQPAGRSACAFPGRLSLDLGERGGGFVLRAHADRAGVFALPGGGETWPEDVVVDRRPVAVVGSADSGAPPSVRLDPGAHEVRGRFVWPRLPSVILVPEDIGLVELRIAGQPVAFPARDDRGRLWLRAGGEESAQGERRIEVEIHRKVTDEVPLLLETRLVLQISGPSREERLGPPLPPDFTALSLASPLPARFEPDGRLRVQVRPGRFELGFLARHEGPADALSLGRPAAGDTWAASEVWVFEAQPALRLVSVEGEVVDPQQTSLPPEWRLLPAYRMEAGGTLKLVERRRGDSEPAPDELALRRSWYLDFDGGGVTVSDRLEGRIHARTRLEMGAGTELGRASVNGADQFLTRLAQSAKTGVQLSPGNVVVEADSRVSGAVRRLPAVGWDRGVASLRASLELPPGYELFHASGVDRARWTWIARWSLLDLFVALVVAVAFLRLYGPAIGALAALALVLTATETGSPRWIWVAVLAVEALRRAVPRDRFRRTLLAARFATLAALVVVAVPFAVAALRAGLYPALATPSEPVRSAYSEAELAADAPSGEAPAATESVLGYDAGEGRASRPGAAPAHRAREEKMRGGSEVGRLQNRAALSANLGSKRLPAVDPNARITTGPGIPRWSWRRVDLEWSGPVPRDAALSLWLIPPWASALAALLRAALLGILSAAVLGVRLPRPRLPSVPGAALALALLPFAAPHAAVAADLPPKALLDELRERLTETVSCAPRCAEIATLRVAATPAALTLALDVSAATTTAVPLPGGAASWLPSEVRVDGTSTSALLRGEGGTLWLRLDPGVHRIELEGALPPDASVALPLPLQPHRAEAVLSGWTLHGMRPDGGVEETLQLVRDAVTAEEAKREAPSLPPFLRVTRSLGLGLTWDLHTVVSRLSPVEAAVVIELPLLDGESVTTPGVPVRDRRARIALAPGTASARFDSVLETRDTIALRAPENVPWSETWRVLASPIWQLVREGIPPIQAESADPTGIDFEWRPWPGETVRLGVARPEGVGGATLTLDSARLELRPGLRSADATLELAVRSSRGGEHRVALPEGSTLQRVAIDGVEQPLRQEGRAVVLPVRPGTAAVELGWRESDGIRTLWRAAALDLGAPAVNVEITVRPPLGRWILFLAGPPLGPAVLFWPVLAAYLAIAWALGRTRLAPLGSLHWALLALGLTQIGVIGAGVVAFWLLALGWRAEHGTRVPGRWFDLLQGALVALTLAALAALFDAIRAGLLGGPDMQIAGQGSSAEMLRWYQDRSEAVLPRPRIVSVPLGVYRILMLAWALWIAWALVGWLRFGWRAFSAGELWRPCRRPARPAAPGGGGM